MRNLMILVCLFFLLTISGCKERAPKPPPLIGRYTIWVGSAAFATGTETNEYVKADDMITFTNIRNGKTITVPVCGIYQIESNK